MAKQATSAVERHLDKGVLGVCAALLLAVIAFYLVTSPNKTEVGGRQVAPDAVYHQIAAEAERLRRAVINTKPEEPKITMGRVSEISQGIREPLEYAGVLPELKAPLPPAPRVPDVGEVIAPDAIQLARFIAPKSVRVAHGRTVVDLVPQVDFGDKTGVGDPELYRTAVNWVTVFGLYSRFEQERLCREAGYKLGRRNQYVVGVDLQRRERRWDGTYTDWEDVKVWSERRPPEPPSVRLIQRGDQQVVPLADRDAVREFADTVRAPVRQLDLMRPLFPIPLAGDFWQLPEYEGIDILALDDELLNPENPGQYPYDNRYQDLLEPKEPDALYKESVAIIRDLLDNHRDSLPELQEAEARCDELLRLPLSDSEQKEVEQLQEEVEGAIRAWERRHPGEGAKSRPKQAPVQVVWAHDLMTGSVASGRTYQYRMRFRFLNRYAALPNDLEHLADAQRVVVVGEWSEPTEDSSIPPDTEFFVASANTARRQVKAEIFKWVAGTWVKSSFYLEEGKPITGQRRMTVNDEPMFVEFDTGAVVIDIDFNRPYRPVLTRDGRLSVKLPKSTVAVVCVDASGQLQERLLAFDKESPTRKELSRKTKRKRTKPRRDTGRPEPGPPRGDRGGRPGPPSP